MSEQPEVFTECPRCGWESPIWEGWAGTVRQLPFACCQCCNYPGPRSDEE